MGPHGGPPPLQGGTPPRGPPHGGAPHGSPHGGPPHGGSPHGPPHGGLPHGPPPAQQPLHAVPPPVEMGGELNFGFTMS